MERWRRGLWRRGRLTSPVNRWRMCEKSFGERESEMKMKVFLEREREDRLRNGGSVLGHE